jgi:hypothetical protein
MKFFNDRSCLGQILVFEGFGANQLKSTRTAYKEKTIRWLIAHNQTRGSWGRDVVKEGEI